MLEFLIDPLPPETTGLIAMAIGRDHQVLARVARAGCPLPSSVPGSFEAPTILLVNRNGFLKHLVSPGPDYIFSSSIRHEEVFSHRYYVVLTAQAALRVRRIWGAVNNSCHRRQNVLICSSSEIDGCSRIMPREISDHSTSRLAKPR